MVLRVISIYVGPQVSCMITCHRGPKQLHFFYKKSLKKCNCFGPQWHAIIHDTWGPWYIDMTLRALWSYVKNHMPHLVGNSSKPQFSVSLKAILTLNDDSFLAGGHFSKIFMKFQKNHHFINFSKKHKIIRLISKVLQILEENRVFFKKMCFCAKYLVFFKFHQKGPFYWFLSKKHQYLNLQILSAKTHFSKKHSILFEYLKDFSN